MKALLALAFAGFLLAPFAAGQKLDLKLDSLASKATDKSEVDLDGGEKTASPSS